jgi:hypothetical protein
MDTATTLDRNDERDVKAAISSRLAALMDMKESDLKELETDPNMMATPSVLSAVRATAYVRC